MRRPTTLLSSCALLAVMAIASPASVAACSCSSPGTLEENRTLAKTIFSGRVRSIALRENGVQLVVQFEPLARWKGGLEATVSVITGLDEAGCGYPFQVDHEYLVFAFGGTAATSPLSVSNCGLTSPLAGNPFVPLLGAPLLPTGTRSRTWGALKLHYR